MSPWIVMATIVGYFVLLFMVSWFASRKSDNASFFTGNRQASGTVAHCGICHHRRRHFGRNIRVGARYGCR